MLNAELSQRTAFDCSSFIQHSAFSTQHLFVGIKVLAAAYPALNRFGEGSSPSGPTVRDGSRRKALVVQRHDSALVMRQRGFESRPVLWFEVHGSSSDVL